MTKAKKSPARRKPRDYSKEYQQRMARGEAKGLTRAEARGHATAEKSSIPPIFKPVHRGDALDRAIQNMAKNRASLTKAAKQEGISPERLRKYLKENTEAAFSRGKWTIVDRRAVALRFPTKGKLRTVRVERQFADKVSRFLQAIKSFLHTRKAFYLEPFAGAGVTDVNGVFHRFETRPNVLLQLEAKDELSFQELYDDTAPDGR